MRTELLTANLLNQSKDILKSIESLRAIDSEFLNWKSNPGSWCALECVEHLNRYLEYYNPEIEKAIKRHDAQSEIEFKSSWLGAYFSKSMLPKDKLNKMKTLKSMDPINANLERDVIDKFIKLQNDFIELLQASKSISLSKTRVTTSLSRLIRLKLGDTFQFLVNHNLRHIAQIEKTIQLAKKSMASI